MFSIIKAVLYKKNLLIFRYLPTAVLRDQISVSGVGTTAKIRDFHSKDTKGRVKSSKRKYADEAFFVTKEAEKINDR